MPEGVETQSTAEVDRRRQALGSLPWPCQQQMRQRSPFPYLLWGGWARGWGLRWNRPTSAPTFNFQSHLGPVCKLQGFFMNYHESYSMPSTQRLNIT